MKELQKQVVNSTLKGIDIQIVDGRVSARDLHSELKVDTRFNDWIARRIEEYGFEEGVDFTTSKIDYSKMSNQNKRGGDRRSVEYSITLGMAKELAMLEKNELGRQVRKYFIKCEENLIEAVKQNMVPKEMYLEAAAELKDLEQANELLTNQYNDVKLMWNNCTNDIMEFAQSQLSYKKAAKARCIDVYNAYHRWSENNQHSTPRTQKEFDEELPYWRVQGHPIVKQGNYYLGIEVRKQ